MTENGFCKGTRGKLLAASIIVVTLITAFMSMASPAPKPSKNAKKAFKEAERLSVIPAKATEAANFISEALADSFYMNDAKAYYIAGKIQAGVFHEGMKKISINRNDPSVDRVKMADALLDAYKYYRHALSLDSVKDSKGRIKTTYSGQIEEWMSSMLPQFYNAGITYLNKKIYYPRAYDAFMIYAQSPDSFPKGNNPVELSDSVRANAFFYAGVMAFNAGEYGVSAEAFKKAKDFNYPRKEVLINEMVCYRRIAEADSTFLPTALDKITDIALEGVEKFGMETPMFVQKYVAGAISKGEPLKGVEVIDSLLSNPTNPQSLLLSLRAESLLAAADTAAAINDYIKAADDSTASFQTLLEASKLLAKEGIEELSQITGTGKQARKKRNSIKESHLKPARDYALRARDSIKKREGIYGELTDEMVNEMISDTENTIAAIDFRMIQ